LKLISLSGGGSGLALSLSVTVIDWGAIAGAPTA
jgi:hypothetical protein